MFHFCHLISVLSIAIVTSCVPCGGHVYILSSTGSIQFAKVCLVAEKCQLCRVLSATQHHRTLISAWIRLSLLRFALSQTKSG